MAEGRENVLRYPLLFKRRHHNKSSCVVVYLKLVIIQEMLLLLRGKQNCSHRAVNLLSTQDPPLNPLKILLQPFPSIHYSRTC